MKLRNPWKELSTFEFVLWISSMIESQNLFLLLNKIVFYFWKKSSIILLIMRIGGD